MYIGEEVCIQDFVRKPEGKRPLGRPRRRSEKILRWTFRKWDGGGYGLYCSGSGYGQVVGTYECVNEL